MSVSQGCSQSRGLVLQSRAHVKSSSLWSFVEIACRKRVSMSSPKGCVSLVECIVISHSATAEAQARNCHPSQSALFAVVNVAKYDRLHLYHRTYSRWNSEGSRSAETA